MYRIIKYLLVLMAIQIVGYAYGVSRDYYQDNMTSAQTADMIRYGDVEASLYTGLLNLSIPIYSLDDPDFSLDISLHYNSEGFKPCENSGFVGYKWSLRAGGCITREVRNIPDETIYRNQSANIYEEGMYIPEPSLRDPSHPDGWLPPSCVAGHPFLTDMGSVLQVQTFYEKMFLEMGLPITYMAFVIDHEGPYAFPGEAFDHDYWLEAEGPRRSFSHQPSKRG